MVVLAQKDPKQGSCQVRTVERMFSLKPWLLHFPGSSVGTLALTNLPQLKKTLNNKRAPYQTDTRSPKLRSDKTARGQRVEPLLRLQNLDGACGRQTPAGEDTSSTHRKKQPGPRPLCNTGQTGQWTSPRPASEGLAGSVQLSGICLFQTQAGST